MSKLRFPAGGLAEHLPIDLKEYKRRVVQFVSEVGRAVNSLILDDLTDVVITGAATNDVLKFDGTNWVNSTSLALAGTFSASNILSGTYTPTLTNTANIDASTTHVCQYLRVGNVVTVSGYVNVDPTTAGVQVTLGISLPIASAFANPEDCGGTASATNLAGQVAGIFADAANDRATMSWLAVDVTSHAMPFSFTYRVI